MEPLADNACEGRIDLPACADIEDLDLQPDGASSRCHVFQRGLGTRRIGRIDEHTNTTRSRQSCLVWSPVSLDRAATAPIYMIGTGWVASAGALIYLAGEKKTRFCLPNTRFLLHQPMGGARGPA